MESRSYFWDNFKGILIFLVVLGHYLYSYATHMDGRFVDHIVTFIYIFHMPAFVFCSGYLSKSEKSRSMRSIIMLLLYYLVFNTSMMIFDYLYLGTQIKVLVPYYSYWYLLSLIVWRFVIGDIARIKGIVPISFVVALLVGYYPEFTNLLSIRRTIAFFVFFLLGFLFRKEQFEKLIEKRNWKVMAVGWLAALVGSIVLFLIVRRYDITLTMTLAGKYKSFEGLVFRVFIFGVALCAISAMLLSIPDKKIPLLTTFGKNSLLIYLVHRFPTLVFAKIFSYKEYTRVYLIYALVCTLITCIVLGGEWINQKVSGYFRRVADTICEADNKTGNVIKTGILVCFVLVLCIKPIANNFLLPEDPVQEENASEYVLSKEQEEAIENSIVLNYVGDLILLKDQVIEAYDDNTGVYDFDKMFEYAKPYLSDADLSLAVFEGPVAGEEIGYSSSNYGDGLPLYLNFPDDFAQAAKDAGIDLVTTANNHLLDKEREGAMRTLDILDEVGLKHTGSYRNQEEKDELLIVEVDGVKIAVLSYLKNVNYYKADELYEEMPYITSIMPLTKNKYYDELYAEIEADFQQAKASDADVILVMAHMGTQFSNETDAFQNKWNEVFAELGADIVLGDHAHAVQPIEYMGDTLIVNCPGNFANSYIGHYGDATSMVEIYIDKDTKKVVASSVIPMYTHEVEEGYFRALPIYEIMANKDLYDEMSAVEIERIKSVQNLVTEVMLKEKLSLKDVQQRYYYIDNYFYKTRRTLLKTVHEYDDKELYHLIKDAQNITFIGDSITEGTKNDYHPWYEPIMEDFPDKTVNNIAKGSYTTKLILRDYSNDIRESKSDLYVLAIGTNDIRYRDEERCAMTAQQYVAEMEKIVKLIRQSNPDAKVVILSPWTTCDGDTISKLNHEAKEAMIDEYVTAMKVYADDKGYYFIDQNEYLREFYQDNYYKVYARDAIHPVEGVGVELYSKAVLECSETIN